MQKASALLFVSMPANTVFKWRADFLMSPRPRLSRRVSANLLPIVFSCPQSHFAGTTGGDTGKEN